MTYPRNAVRMLRYAVQFAFLLVTFWIGWRFYHFILQFGSPGHPVVPRPESVDAFLPIGGFMALKYFLFTGIVEPVHPAGFFLFIGICGVSLLLKKGFCGWICPIGTISQYVWMAGEKVVGRNFRPKRDTDIVLRAVKYVLMGFFVVLIGVLMPLWSMTLFFISDYYKAVDLRMMKFFTDMSLFTLVVLAGLVVLSFLSKNVWCRYLCPYGALLGLLSKMSPVKVRRNEESCVHCGACTRSCPALIDVEKQTTVSSAECIGCLTCVSHCPSKDALDISVRRKKGWKAFSPFLYPVLLVALFYLAIGIGMASGKWKSQLPYEEYQRLVPDVQKEYSSK